MYTMCVYLFSALSHRVGALQISIIIIIKAKNNNTGTTQGCMALREQKMKSIIADSKS